MSDPMLKLNVDEILANGPSSPNPEQLRELLEAAYTAGAFEAAVAPSAPGDPGAAERELTHFAVAARLALTTGALSPLQAALDAHLARKSR